MDASTVVAALATINITTVESVLRACPLSFSSFSITLNLMFFKKFIRQLPHEALVDMKKTFNGPGNVNIAPIHVVEEVGIG